MLVRAIDIHKIIHLRHTFCIRALLSNSWLFSIVKFLDPWILAFCFTICVF